MKNTKLGKKIIKLEQVNSTNQFAKELIINVNDLQEGTTIVSYDQFQGKGRHQKTWISEKNKNLCISIILFPDFLTTSNLFLLSKTISVGIWDFLDRFYITDTRIKWPNDIYVQNNKIAGILIENTWKGNVLQESIIGIGLNVNQTHFPSIINQPTSMKLLRKQDFNLEEMLTGLLESIEIRYRQLCRKEIEAIDTAYHEALFRLNETTHFLTKDEKLSGKIKAVDHDGKIQILTDQHGLMRFELDDIEFIHES